MIKSWAQKLIYAFLGVGLAATTLVLYWQTEAGSKQLSKALANDNQFADNDLDLLQADSDEEDEVLFVGCGGLF